MLNLIIVLLFGCFIPVFWIIKLIDSMNAKWLQRDSNPQPLSSTYTQPFSQTGQIIQLCCCYKPWTLFTYHNDKRSSFDELLVKDNSVSVHHNNIHTLVIEMYTVANGMSSEIMNDVFMLRDETHHLKHAAQFLVDPIHSVFNGSESAPYLGPKFWV